MKKVLIVDDEKPISGYRQIQFSQKKAMMFILHMMGKKPWKSC